MHHGGLSQIEHHQMVRISIEADCGMLAKFVADQGTHKFSHTCEKVVSFTKKSSSAIHALYSSIYVQTRLDIALNT